MGEMRASGEVCWKEFEFLRMPVRADVSKWILVINACFLQCWHTSRPLRHLVGVVLGGSGVSHVGGGVVLCCERERRRGYAAVDDDFPVLARESGSEFGRCDAGSAGTTQVR